MRSLCLLVASLTLAACATSTPQSTPPTPRPQLDSKLAEPCPAIGKPEAADYDIWLLWALDLLEQYGACAAKHAKTVQAWPK